MKKWLVELAKDNKYLMVRSTGAEDSKKSANAGGNASIAYVKPTQEELSKAIGEVVRSYFSVGSIQKRLNANLDPFEDELRVAVTTQELIGEDLGGAKDTSEIPVSLVLFTSEPLYIGEEEFRAMRISATYGHGEGVVGNRGIASDTALVLISASDPSKLYVLYDNQEKPERLAPVRDPVSNQIILEKIANSAEMAKTPSLNDDLISRIYTWGVIGEKYFEDFTDMEIVVKGGTIFPVQGRPINREKLSATYLDPKKIADLSETPVKSTLLTEMIVPGKAAVVEITKPDEILIVETLEKAEGLFKKGQHKLVVVGQPEPANSHPVVNFSALGMPCLYAKELSEVQNLAGQINPSNHLAVCVQSGTVSLWDTSKGKVEEFTTEGFVVHPAKIAASLPFKDPLPQKAGMLADVQENVKATLYSLRTATNNQDALLHFTALKNDVWIKGLDAKIVELEEKVAKQPLFEHAVRPTIEMAKSLKKKIDAAFSEVETLLKRPGGPDRLEFLMHEKVLETFLFQRPVSQGAISQKSLLTMQENFAAADAMMIYQSQLEHPAHFVDILMDGTQSPIEAVYEEWSKFLLRLESVAEPSKETKSHFTSFLITTGLQQSELTQTEITRFKTTLHTLRQGGALPLFMTFFLSSMDLNDPVGTVRAIIASLPSNEEPIIEQIFAQRNEIKQIRNDVAQIANSKTYAEMLAKLEKAVDDFLPENQSWLKKDQWEKASPITRSIALQTMNDLVDLYDTAIKTMKASPEMGSDVEKTKKFKEMLGPNLKLLKAWSQHLVGAENYQTHAGWPLNLYMETVEEIFSGLAESDPANLRPSRDFSVSAAVLGALTAFDRHNPRTLEDMFTLIHQNLIVSTALLTKELFSSDQIKNSPLLDLLKASLESVNKIGGGEVGVPQQTGIEVDQTGITFYYNIPLRNHSGKLSIHYDRATETIRIQGQFLGESRERWAQGKEKLEILNRANILPLQSEVKQTQQEITFTWNIKTREQLERAFEEYQTQAGDSMADMLNESSLRDFIDDVTKAKDNDLSEITAFLLNENKNELTAYGMAIIDLDLDTSSDFPLLSGSSFLKLLSVSQHPLVNGLKAFLIGQLNGKELGEILKGISRDLRNFIENGLAQFQKDPLLIYRLPISSRTMDIWKALISQPGCAISEVLERAQQAMRNQNPYVRDPAVKLLIEIAKQGQWVPKVISIAQQSLQDQEAWIRGSAVDLLGEIAKLIGISEIISIAQKVLLSQKSSVRFSVVELLIQIAKQGQGIPDLIHLAQQALQDEHNSVRYSVVNLLIQIARQGQGISEIIPLAQKAWDDKNLSIRSLTVKLLIVIVMQGRGIAEIIPIAQQALQDRSWHVSNLARDLLIEIAKQGQGIPEIISIAKQAMQVEAQVSTAFSLLTSLVRQGQAIPEIISIAQQAFQNQDLWDYTFKLLIEIVRQGQAILEIIPLAQQTLQDQNSYYRVLAVNLLIEIAKQGQGIEEIKLLTQQTLNDPDREVRILASELQEIINRFGK